MLHELPWGSHDHAPPNPSEIDDENQGRPTSVLMPGVRQAWR